MNILSGTANGHQLTLSNGSQIESTTVANGPVKIGIRPEHLIQDDTGNLVVDNGMVEQLGSNTLVHGTLSDDTTPVVYSLPGIHTEQSLGTSMRLRVNQDALHLFNTDTGERID